MSGEFSREALRARLGDAAFEAAERAALEAPTPSPEVVERIRLIFAPHVKRLLAEHSAARQHARAA